MRMTLVLVLVLSVVGVGLWGYQRFWQNNRVQTLPLPQVVPATPTSEVKPTGEPKAYQFSYYQVPEVPRDDAYTVFLVGDSMTKALGPHPSKLSAILNEAYPDKNFVIDNYAEGGQNILQMMLLLSSPLELESKTEQAALKRDFDILVVESFGHNPLSEHERDEGLRLQEETLERLMTEVTWNHPQAIVIFLATLAPSPQEYAAGILDIPSEQLPGWVSEREAYIENHIRFAREHGIPLVNVYEKHQNPDGTVMMEYINDDKLHPSQAGADWIQEELGNFIVTQQYLPR